MSGGFAAGVHSVNPKVKIRFAEIGPAAYDDSAGGKRVAQTLMSAGADVIFGMGDDASFGYLQAILNANVGHKVWYIGDIGDMTPIDTKHVLLSSELWSFQNAFDQAVKDITNGTYGRHGYNLDPGERGYLAAQDLLHPGGRLEPDPDRPAEHHLRAAPGAGRHHPEPR